MKLQFKKRGVIVKKFKFFSKNRNIRVGVLALCLALVASVISQTYTNINTHAANTLAGNNEVISVATTDGQPANSSVGLSGVSSDGNVILFSSKATNLPDEGGPDYSTAGGLYTYNIMTDTTARVDISTNGTLPDQGGAGGVISGSGRYVYFISWATNLIDGHTQYSENTYIRDLQAGTTTAVSDYYWGGYSRDYDYPLGISNDGQFILLASDRTGVGYSDFYNAVLGDRRTGSFALTSLGQAFSIDTVDLNSGGMSCDGAFAIYEKTSAIKLVDLRDTVSTASYITGDSAISPIISCNGDYILYATQNRTDVSPTPSGMDSYLHLVEYNRITGERNYIDSNSAGVFDSGHRSYQPINNYSYGQPANIFNASVADTGDVVLQYDGNYYLKHISDGSGTLESVGKTAGGTYINVSKRAYLTSDGRYVFFTADPYDLGIGVSPAGNQIIRTKTDL